MTDYPLNILVVDDDDVTAEAVARALKKHQLTCRVIAAEDGCDALAVLRGQTNRRIDKPYIILLDLNMPRMNGFEFLEHLRDDKALSQSVVFVLSTTGADADRSRAYHKLIAGYMVKSEIGPMFSKLSALLMEYANAVRLPD